jgi:hypothetical protein
MLPTEQYRDLQRELIRLNAELMRTLHQDHAGKMRSLAQQMSDQLSTAVPGPAAPSIPIAAMDVDPIVHDQLMVGAVEQAIRLEHFESGLISAGRIMNEPLRTLWSNKLYLAWANSLFIGKNYDRSEQLAKSISDGFPGRAELLRKLEKYKRPGNKKPVRPKVKK